MSFTSDQIGDSLSPLTVFRDQKGLQGIVASLPSVDEVRRLILSGFGIGCLPKQIVRDDIAQHAYGLPPEEGLVVVYVHLL